MELDISLLTRIESALGDEYRKSLVEPLSLDSDSEERIAWPDISVFFYNRNCQNVLDEVKRIWDLVPGSRLGRKSLREFFRIYTEKMIKRHILLRHLSTDRREIGSALAECRGQLKTRGMLPSDSSKTSGEKKPVRWVSEEDFRIREEDDGEVVTDIRIGVLKLQLFDLANAFNDGFLGYSLEVIIGKDSQETHPADVRGNVTEWCTNFALPLRGMTKSIVMTLYQHSSQALKPPKSKIASITLDPFSYLLTDQDDESRVIEKMLTMESEEMERPPKLFFTIAFPHILPDEALLIMQRRKAALEGKFEQLSSDITRLTQVLTQQKAAFDSVQFNEDELIVVEDIDKRNSGFRVCVSSANGRKHCLIM